jgi:hypothetical protein
MKVYLKGDGFKMEDCRILSLEELAKKEYPILFDSSVIIRCLNENKELKTIKEKIDATKKDRSFYFLMRTYIEKSHFYISFDICNELQAGEGYPPKKNKLISWNFPNHKEILELRREKIKTNKEKSRLVNAFINNDKIFQLNDKEQNSFSYLHQKYLHLAKDYNLSDADFNISILGISRAKKSGPVALASNDYGICKICKVILKEENVPYKFEIFARKNFLDFEKIFESF